jgi:hypothetical protein
MKTALGFARSVLIAAVAIATFTMAGVPRAAAQAANSAALSSPGQARSLYITIVEGEGALNDIRTRTAREPIVQVDDENHKPVAGALVLFALDKSGSSYANFSGVSNLSVRTDQAGRAVARGFQITGRKGNYTIHVHASYGALVAEAAILETNVAVLLGENGSARTIGGLSHKKVWIVSSIVVAGAIAGIIAATQQSSPTTVSAGTGSVGAPAAVGGVRFALHSRHP